MQSDGLFANLTPKEKPEKKLKENTQHERQSEQKQRRKPGKTGGDITKNRHKGNARSEAAYEKNKDHFTRQQQRILDLLFDRGALGLIAHEAARLLSIPIASASARFSELKAVEAIAVSDLQRETQYGNRADVCVLPQFLEEANKKAVNGK
jgi:hypothetical protein